MLMKFLTDAKIIIDWKFSTRRFITMIMKQRTLKYHIVKVMFLSVKYLELAKYQSCAADWNTD